LIVITIFPKVDEIIEPFICFYNDIDSLFLITLVSNGLALKKALPLRILGKINQSSYL